MILTAIDGQVGRMFSGVFQAYESRWERAANGTLFLRFAIVGASGKVRAHGWEGSYHGPMEIPKGAFLLVSGRLTDFEGHLIANIHTAEFLTVPLDQELKNRLFQVVNGISNVPLRNFVQSVFLTQDIARPFFSAPASCSQHHSFPRGLLVHSLECAEFVQCVAGFTPEEKEIGVVSALLHDVGKIWTNDPRGFLTPTGRLVGHDYLTNEILARPLAELTLSSPEIANFLRHLWGWLGTRCPRPPAQHPLAEVLATADHVSAHRCNESLAFRELRPNRQHAQFQGRRYFRFRTDPPRR